MPLNTILKENDEMFDQKFLLVESPILPPITKDDIELRNELKSFMRSRSIALLEALRWEINKIPKGSGQIGLGQEMTLALIIGLIDKATKTALYPMKKGV